MAKAISDAKAFHALLNGGYVCMKCEHYTEKRTYSVFVKDESAQTGYRMIGHITERQFVNFLQEHVLMDLDFAGRPPRQDKYKNIYYFYGAQRLYSVEELKALTEKERVWIEVLRPFDSKDKVSAYYRKTCDYSQGTSFCCGYPGLSFAFDYEDYGLTWHAFHQKP